MAPRVPIAAAETAAAVSQPQHVASPKRTRLACQQCRQSKLRCEQEAAGQLCVRCSRLGLECVFDDFYKRVNKRLKVQELVEEVQQLRSTVQQRIYSPDSSIISPPSSLRPSLLQGDRSSQVDELLIVESTTSPAMSSHSPGMHRSNGAPGRGEDFQIAAPTVQTAPTAALSSRRLGTVNLVPAQIDHLFKIYFTSYHTHFPILDVKVSPDQYFASSPVLFWTIVTIASRRDQENSMLLGVLAPLLRELMFKGLGTPPHSRYTIKAWTLNCLWRLPTSSMATDPSFALASAAKSSAMQVGLHRPEIVQDFSRVRVRFSSQELHDAIMTWVATFVAAESVTSFIGQPSLYASDRLTDLLATRGEHEALPEELMIIMQAFKFINKVNCVLSHYDSRSSRAISDAASGLFTMIEREYDVLCSSVLSTSTSTEIILLLAALQLRSYHFFEQPGSSLKREGLLRGYGSALTMASKAHAAHVDSNLFRYAPDIFYNSVTLAAMFIIKVAKSEYSKDIDMREARRCFGLCHALMRQISLEDNDLPGRTSKIIEQLWNFDDPGRLLVEPTLKVTTRLSGSLLHDTLWMWRETFGGQKKSAPQSPKPNVHQFSQSIANPNQASSEDVNCEGISADHSKFLESAPHPVEIEEMTNNSSDQTLTTAPALTGIPEPLSSNYDLNLMPESYSDFDWERQLDELISLDFYNI